MYRQKRDEKFLDRTKLDFLDSETGKIRWLYIAAILTDAVISFFTGIMIIITFRFALYGRLNQGIISSLFSITSIYLSIISWLFFKETLKVFHFFGMILMIAWALLVVFSKDKGEKGAIKVYNDIVEEISPVWSVLFAIVCTAWFCTRTMLMKVYYKSYGFDPMNLTVISYIVQGIILIIVIINLEPASLDVMRDSLIAGAFGFLGNIFVNHATSKGYAGPAAALTNIQVILQVIIDAVFLSQIPNFMQILAWICGIFGSLSLTLGPIIFDKLKKKLGCTK